MTGFDYNPKCRTAGLVLSHRRPELPHPQEMRVSGVPRWCGGHHAESHLTGTLFRQILGRIERLAWHPTGASRGPFGSARGTKHRPISEIPDKVRNLHYLKWRKRSG